MTGRSVSDYFRDARNIAAIIAGLIVGGGGAMALSGATTAPATDHTPRLDNHEARISSLEESRRFQNCWLLESAAGRDPNPCRYLLPNPDEFRPPFNVVQ